MTVCEMFVYCIGGKPEEILKLSKYLMFFVWAYQSKIISIELRAIYTSKKFCLFITESAWWANEGASKTRKQQNVVGEKQINTSGVCGVDVAVTENPFGILLLVSARLLA